MKENVWRVLGIELLRERYSGPQGVHISKMEELTTLIGMLPVEEQDETLMAVVNWRPTEDATLQS